MLFGCELQSLRDLTDLSRGFHGSISLSIKKIRMGLSFWVKIDSQNVQESFAFLQKDFTHLQYHTLYHTLKQ